MPLDYGQGVTLTAAVALSVGKVLDRALHFIPLHLATHDLPSGSAIYDAVAELRRFSLVDSRDGVLAIHRIVQEIIRAMLDGDAVDVMQGRFQFELVRRLYEEGVTTEVWVLQAPEAIIDRAEALLREHTDAGPDVLATVVQRRAVLAWTRHQVGHPDGGTGLCLTLMRESMELFEAAGQSHVPRAATSGSFLEMGEQAAQGGGGASEGGRRASDGFAAAVRRQRTSTRCLSFPGRTP
ncbi:hypothetical protein [Streptomyces sp. HNM1019]|uniref:hypothetical protein n=1 Tax=Streptomyces sp. HNM1019 TaxID=3424717 RepID=UPI003D778AA8